MGFYRNCCIAVGHNDMDCQTLAVVLLAAVAAVVQWMGRRRVNNLTMMVLTGAVASFSAADGEEVRDPAKKLWTYFYEKPKWHAFKSQSFDRQFNMHMHMPASAFNLLCAVLAGDLDKEDTRFRPSIKGDERIALSLHLLAGSMRFGHCG